MALPANSYLAFPLPGGTGERVRSSLVNRNVKTRIGRTSMRLEPELWEALREICLRENVGEGELVRHIDARTRAGSRTSAVRVFVLNYFRAAATEQGHDASGHGPMPGEA